MSEVRLIDANALKYKNLAEVNGKLTYVLTAEEINNAPTVEVPENEVNCVLTMFGECSYNKTGCSDCEIKVKIRKALEERPQGEWIPIPLKILNGDDIVAYKSSCCGAIADKKYQHCPKCNEKMEVKKNEQRFN